MEISSLSVQSHDVMTWHGELDQILTVAGLSFDVKAAHFFDVGFLWLGVKVLMWTLLPSTGGKWEGVVFEANS